MSFQPPPQVDLGAGLARRRAEGLYRRRLVLASPQGPEVTVDGRRLLSFCGNDYLGLADHPELAAAFRRAAEHYGVGAGASHLVTGHLAPHHELEEALAAFVGAPRALLCSTGYMANLGVVTALAGRSDTVCGDRLNHASLVDAALLSRARYLRYRHADCADLERALGDDGRAALVATDGVFSMDGDLAPLPALSEIAVARGARLLVDDAHGLGVLGAGGRGVFEHFDVPLAPPAILMGTLGKALGSFGAFVAGEEDLVETLIQAARPYIYTTALPPAVAAAAGAALRLVQTEPWRRDHLRALVQRFRAGAAQLDLPLMDSTTPIQPVLLGDPRRAVSVSDKLRARGILVTAIRPPTVPRNTARLRITFSAAHRMEHVDRLLDALGATIAGTPPAEA